MTANEKLYLIADELRALASLGLKFSGNSYDHERYEKIFHLSADLVAALEDRVSEEIVQEYSKNFSHFSPLIGVEAAVFREGKLLLIRRRDNGLWAVPGGLSEVGETLSQAALRELWEEAGIHGSVQKILGVFDSRFWKISPRYHLFAVVCLVDSDEIPQLHQESPAAPGTVTSFLETLEVGFFAEEALPPLSLGHDTRVPLIFKLFRGEAPVPYFD